MEKMSFFEWLEAEYGINHYEWDENYDPTRCQGKEIVEDYQYYLTH